MPCPPPPPLLTLRIPTSGTYADSHNLTNVKSISPIPSSTLVAQMGRLTGTVGITLPDLKSKVPSPPDIEPRLTLESLGRTRHVEEPVLALQCTASAMDMEVTSTSLGALHSAAETTSSLPPWMSNLPSAPLPAPVGSDVRTPASAFIMEKDTSFLSKSPSVSLSLSPSSSDPVVSSGSASPASEVIATRSWLQDTARHKDNINGVVGVVKESKANLTWCSPDKQGGISSFDPSLVSSRQAADSLIMQQLPTFFQYCKELDEGRQSWFMHKKEATWRLSRLEQQLESEKTRKRREKIEEIGAKIRALREEEIVYLDKLETDCREQLSSLQRDAEIKEAKMMELWTAKHQQLTKFVEQMVYQYPDAHGIFSKDIR